MRFVERRNNRTFGGFLKFMTKIIELFEKNINLRFNQKTFCFKYKTNQLF